MIMMRHVQPTQRRLRAAFTLVEMLVVLLIIAILLGILLPTIAGAKIRAKAGLAKLDCAAIATAITQYHTDYNHYPVAKGQVANTLGGDLTFNPPGGIGGGPSNSDAMIILSALEELGGSKPNAGHSRNISKRRYLDDKLVESVEKPGMGPDGVFRDPFGNPFVITVDLNGNDHCFDLFYADPAVSGPDLADIGQNGMMKTIIGAQPAYVLPKNVMVWSPGPDREINITLPAKQGVNNDNIIGWQ